MPPAAAGPADAGSDTAPELSVVVPVCNEAGNIHPLIAELRAALDPVVTYEIIYVDDGSTDDTFAELTEARAGFTGLRVIRLARNAGQSTAWRVGILAARAPLIATLDGDGQNDPADIPRMIERYRAPDAPANLRLIVGWRVKRNDDWLRRLSSRVGNGVRGWLLADGTPDTACALKLYARDAYLLMPFFDHVHRFMPALFQRDGFAVEHMPVNHRPRVRGVAKYGVMNRLWVSLVDVLGVMWLLRRTRRAEIAEEL